ncbi:DUF86 domain-containing protein [Paraburkholderia nemoris]|uniref:HepT-like ribonuclease domain-containing protein n=1 Tax=Paraburkholderia nemoris TaxID=2793076 RepID=UPI0038B6C46C
MSRSGVDLCDDIRRSILHIRNYLEDYTVGKALPVVYMFDFKTQDAVIYRLMIIGEAGGDLIERHSPAVAKCSTADYDLESALKQAARMRDLLIHHHWTVDADVIRQTAEGDLSRLRVAIEALKKDL